MATIQELLELRQEVVDKLARVAEMEKTVADLEKELAELEGVEPPLPAAEIKPWYKKWQTYLVLGIGAVITGVAIKKKVAKS